MVELKGEYGIQSWSTEWCKNKAIIVTVQHKLLIVIVIYNTTQWKDYNYEDEAAMIMRN